MASFDSLVSTVEDFFDKPAVKNIIDTGGFSSKIYNITGKPADAGLGAGYGAWVESVTGSLPSVKKLGDKQAQINLSPTQVKQMQGWLDTQVSSALTPGKPKPSLQINFGPVVKPWAIKYGAPALVGVFVLGWLTRWGMYR